MRTVNTADLVPVIKRLIMKACYELNDNVVNAYREALSKEISPYSRETLQLLIDNAEVAKREHFAVCHDTGQAVIILEIGQEVNWEGAPIVDMINEGVRQGYVDGYLRKSVVADPLDGRKNTGDNTPDHIHFELVPGDRLHVIAMPKGGGGENMSCFKNLIPADGIQGVKDYVMECVQDAGGKTCPPIIVGVGVGGTMDSCTYVAKKALLRPIGQRHPNPLYARLEEELIEEINKTGIGTLGMGGTVTALDVHIEGIPTHIASLPVAVNFQCHSSRHADEYI